MKKREIEPPKLERVDDHSGRNELFWKIRAQLGEVRNPPLPTQGSIDPERLKLMGR